MKHRALILGAALCLGAANRAVSQQPAGQGEVFYHVFVRSFSDSDGDGVGDLRGVQDKLKYLQDLGVTSLLLLPINPSPFYHNYFGSSFEGVDRAYGDSADFRALVEAVHARGMKIYLDQEIQYVAEGHPWLEESLGRPGSRYSRFVLYNGAGNTEPESGVFNLSVVPIYNGARIRIATVNMLDAGVLQYFQELFAALVDPNRDGRFEDGVDGFRIDHMMDDLDLKGKLTNLFSRFWVPVFQRMRVANPGARIIAEQFDWGYGEDYLTRGGTDMVFAFPIRNAIVSFNRDSIANAIVRTVEKTPRGKGQLIFIENHDMNRFSSEVDNDPRKLRVGAALSILLPGTPLIYYGQEIGMRGRQFKAWGTDANDIPVREAFEWMGNGEGDATWYRDTGPWWNNRYARANDWISVEEQEGDVNSLLSYYRRVLAVRRSRAELVSGDARILDTDRPSVLAILRSTADQVSLLVANLADSVVTVQVPRDRLPAAFSGSLLKDLLSGEPGSAVGSTLQVTLAPFAVRLMAP